MSRRAHLAVVAALLFTGSAPIHEPNGFLGKLWRLEEGPQCQRPADTPDDFRGRRVDPADAESTLGQTQRDQLVAVVNLYKGLGGRWRLPGGQVAER
jgi:hypothetical protein